MSVNPYRVLAHKRAGDKLSAEEIGAVVEGAVSGSWSDAQLAAFLMASAIRGLDLEETRELTVAMLESGEQWRLSEEFPGLGDKHSTGGIGDKVSLVLTPILAACGQPVVMLTGRGLGHTGGTADKLEAIEGVDLAMDHKRCHELLSELGMAIGVATEGIAPADRVLYGLRDQTATVDSLPLITASILSKKLATGAASLVFDVKTGSGAFLPTLEDARRLARLLVEIASDTGYSSSALITDMSQPLGEWAGHACEIRETLACLEGRGPTDLMEVVYALAEEVAARAGQPLSREDLAAAVDSGRARGLFERWVVAVGGSREALAHERLPLAPYEFVIRADRAGFLTAVENRQVGLLLAEAGGGRVQDRLEIDPSVSLRTTARLGDELEKGAEIARLYSRGADEALEARLTACFAIGDQAEAPPLVYERVTA